MFCISECDEEQFTCSNGQCKPQFFVCDRMNDCGDNSDEEHCGEFLLLRFNERIYLYQHLPFRKLIQMKQNAFKDTLMKSHDQQFPGCLNKHKLKMNLF